MGKVIFSCTPHFVVSGDQRCQSGMSFFKWYCCRETLFQLGEGQNEHDRTEMDDVVNIGPVESTARPQYHSGGCGGVRRGRGELRSKVVWISFYLAWILKVSMVAFTRVVYSLSAVPS